jgi:hypothetical protein
MKTNDEIFGEQARKQNADFHHGQFAKENLLLYKIIMNSMAECQKELKDEVKRLKGIISDDTDYKAMRNYAKELEHRLGINQESGK